tara:strand:- start:4529 stop:6508 length:1980 start_codon:yes stop_codon:yes gene_type:complete
MGISKVIVISADTKAAQKALKEVNLTIEQQEDLLKDTQRQIEKLEDLRNKTSKKDANRIIKYNDEIKKQNKNLKRTKTRLTENKQARSKANTELKNTVKNQRDYSGVLGVIDRQTGGAISGFQGMIQGITGATKGFKLMRIAIIATGIGALVIAITSVATALTNSEAGQNKFAKMMTMIGAVIGNVTDILGNFGNAIISFVTGNFDDALESINKVSEGIKNFGEETKKEIKLAGELADKRAAADKIDRDLLLQRAEANRRFNELREKAADKENVSIADRVAALKEAGRIDEEITKKEIAAAKLRFEAKKLENSLSASTKEDLDEQARLEAELINLETARLKKAKTLTAEITTNLREAEAERKGIEATAKSDQKIIDDEKIKKAKELADLKKNIRDAEAVNEEDARALELTKITEHYQKLIDAAIANDLATDELEAARDDKLKVKQEAFDETDAERKQKIIDDQTAQAEALKKIEDDKKKQQQSTFDNAVALAGAETKLGKMLLLAKQIILAKEFILNAKSSIANAKKALGDTAVKGSEATTEVAGSVAKATNTAAPPFNIPFILTAIATGASVLSAVKAAIGSTKSAAASVGASGGAAVSTPSITPASSPPAFNVIGQGGASQLASAIGGQAPSRAYVVSNDVTTAQGLERNIIEGATI